MQSLRARRVLIGRGALEKPSAARMEAFLGRVEAEEVRVVEDAELERALRALGARHERVRHGVRRLSEPKELIAFARLPAEGPVFPGYEWAELRSAARERRRGVLCQSGVEIQSMVGCPFACAYCPYASFVCVRVDVEAFVERVARLAAGRDCQSLYKLNNRTDTLGLEPEYGLARALVERFAHLPEKHLLLYTKGDAVDSLVGAEHGGKTIASFTLAPEGVAARLEAGAPPPSARIAALGRLARAGYPVRLRFSPIVPMRGWREAYFALVGAVARVAEPEMVTLWTLSMIELDELERVVPLEELEPEALRAATAATAAMRGRKGAPFPPAYRASIYRELAELVRARWPSATTALCLEEPAVWAAAGLSPLPGPGGSWLCNCGPKAVQAGPTGGRRPHL